MWDHFESATHIYNTHETQLPAGLWIVFFGLHLTLYKWWVTGAVIFFVAVLIHLTGISILAIGLSVLSAIFVRWKLYPKMRHGGNYQEYIIHILIVPFILWFLLPQMIPQTDFASGVVLSLLLWTLIHQIMWFTDTWKRKDKFFLAWAIPCLFVFAIAFIFPYDEYPALIAGTIVALIISYVV